MDRILITGVCGFIGSNLAKCLIEDENLLIFGLDNYSYGNISNLFDLFKNPRFQFIEHDLRNKIDSNFDIIFHFAGCGDLKYYFENPFDFAADEILISKNIINLASNSGAKLFFPISVRDYSDSCQNLHRYYDCQKLLENLILDEINSNRLNCLILGLDEIYGENMQKESLKPVVQIIKKAMSGADFELDYDKEFNLSYIKDVVLHIKNLLNNPILEPKVDICHKKTYLESDLIKLIINFTKSNSKLILNSDIKQISDKKEHFTNPLFCSTEVIEGVLNTVRFFKSAYYS